MRKAVLATAVALAAVLFFLLATLPPRPTHTPLDAVDPSLRRRSIAGAYHLHTTRSDGAGTRADVAAAAARAGLRFAIFTDHGDGTRPPDAPAYLSGVLCIDGVEISTNGGHYVALDMAPSPYPLGGESSSVVEDVHRLGGFGVAAHPDHPAGELAWTDWKAPVDALEWINADAEWRDERPATLARVLLAYLIRPGPALATVFDRPLVTLERWDALEKTRRVVALGAVDAHGGARTSYEASLRSLSNRVVLDRPPTGDANVDARLVLDALRAGRVYTVVDAISPDVVLSLSDAHGFELASPVPPGAQTFTIAHDSSRRIEVHALGAPGTPPVPWVVSNWAGPREPQLPPPDPGAPAGETVSLPIASEWRVEKDAESSGRVSGAADIVSLEYKLRSDTDASQFVAAVADLRQAPAFSRLLFRGRAVRPMRVSVQLRFSLNDARWTRSVYLGPDERDVTVDVGEMAPAKRGVGRMPEMSAARSILFVVDLVNARPGDSGAFTISTLRAAR